MAATCERSSAALRGSATAAGGLSGLGGERGRDRSRCYPPEPTYAGRDVPPVQSIDENDLERELARWPADRRQRRDVRPAPDRGDLRLVARLSAVLGQPPI